MTGSVDISLSDGRRRRSARSREAIVKAALGLIDRGILAPTAQQIADAAGVGIRSFFRHFDDMESLFAAIDAHARDQIKQLFEVGNIDRPLTDRLDVFLRSHGQAFALLCPIILSTQAQIWRSEILRERYARDQKNLRAVLLAWFPELQAAAPSVIEAADALTSFEMWYRLRHHQNLSADETRALLKNMLTDFFVANHIS